MFGAILYLAILWLSCTICLLVRRQHLRDKKRLYLVSQLQSIPFGKLAFDVEMSCIICFTAFDNEDDVVQLKCDHRHIFHRDCLKPWIETPSVDRPVACCPLCKKEIEFEE